MYATLAGPNHVELSFLLYSTSSPGFRISISVYLTLCLRAFLILSLASYLMKISLALCLAIQFFLIISLDGSSNDEAGRLLSYMFGYDGLKPNTS